jgi:hypothetical protein
MVSVAPTPGLGGGAAGVMWLGDSVLSGKVPPMAQAGVDMPARYWRVCMLFFLLGLGAALLLPHDPATPFYLLKSTDYIKLGWIYDRLEISPTPVDVAFFGTSHTLNGVDSAILEQGLTAARQGPVHVINVAVPSMGSDLPYLLERMLVARKRPRLLVVEVQQVPARASHPAYAPLAAVSDILAQPLGNPDELNDIVQLPHRQARYFLAGLMAPPPPPERPIADHWDDTYRVFFRGGLIGPPRVTAPPAAELTRNAAHARLIADNKAAGYRKLGWLTFRASTWYLQHMLDDARAHGVRIVFLYLPIFATIAPAVNATWLAQYGEILTPSQSVLADPALWHDSEHLNFLGARVLSKWLVDGLRDKI